MHIFATSYLGRLLIFYFIITSQALKNDSFHLTHILFNDESNDSQDKLTKLRQIMDLIVFGNAENFDLPQEIIKCLNEPNINKNNFPILIHCK